MRRSRIFMPRKTRFPPPRESLKSVPEPFSTRRARSTGSVATQCQSDLELLERNMAERGAEDDRVLSLAAQTAAAGGAAAMPVDVGRRLGFDHGVLEPSEQILGLLQAQTNRLEPVIALVDLQDHLIPDHGVIIADEAKLKLNAHGRPHAELSTNSIW